MHDSDGAGDDNQISLMVIRHSNTKRVMMMKTSFLLKMMTREYGGGGSDAKEKEGEVEIRRRENKTLPMCFSFRLTVLNF